MAVMKRTSSSTDRATAYALAVIAGEIVAGPHVRNACQRHMDDLQNGTARGLKYDEALAARALRFFEGKLKLSEGQFEGRAFQAHPAQAFIIGSLFGWQKLSNDFGWVRRFRRAYIEQGKGNGKSPLAGGIGLYGLMADGESGAEIYAAGATKDQAGILFRDAVKMVGKSPDLAGRIKASGGVGREYNLAYLAKGSFFRPISREAKRTGSGPRPHMALCDEVHEHPDRGVMEMLERGFKFRRQPLLLMITNSGSDRNSVCWEEHEHAVKVAAGNLNIKTMDEHYSGMAKKHWNLSEHHDTLSSQHGEKENYGAESDHAAASNRHEQAAEAYEQAAEAHKAGDSKGAEDHASKAEDHAGRAESIFASAPASALEVVKAADILAKAEKRTTEARSVLRSKFMGTLVGEVLQAAGTSEGVKKSWEKRKNAPPVFKVGDNVHVNDGSSDGYHGHVNSVREEQEEGYAHRYLIHYPRRFPIRF